MSLTESSTEGVAFSRSTGLPSYLGKATAEVKCKLPEPLKDELTRVAHALGLSESEFLRKLIVVRLMGVDAAERMHSEQLRAAAGIGPDTGRAGGFER